MREWVKTIDWFRKRNIILIGGSLLIVIFLFYTDPNGGALTQAFLQQLVTPIISVWFAYVARKALFDYIDMEDLYNKAKDNAIGAGIVFLGLCIVLFALLGLFGVARASEVNTYIPTKAYTYIPTVRAEQQALWVNHPKIIH